MVDLNKIACFAKQYNYLMGLLQRSQSLPKWSNCNKPKVVLNKLTCFAEQKDYFMVV